MHRSAAAAVSAALVLAGLSHSSAEAEGPLEFSNTAPITVDGDFASGTATPYPSTIAVSGVTDPVTSVTVTLHGFGLRHPKDTDVLLEGPTGVAVMLMSDVSQTEVTHPIELAFAADGQPFPAGPGVTPVESGTYLPKDEAELPGTDAGEPPAPAPTTYTTDLTTFNGVDPNGGWKLYVFADVGTGPNDETIGGGWSIAFNSDGGGCTVSEAAARRDACTIEYAVHYRFLTTVFPDRVIDTRHEDLIAVQAGVKGKTAPTPDLLDPVHWRGTLVMQVETTGKDDTTVLTLAGLARVFARNGDVEIRGPVIVHRSNLKGCRDGAEGKLAIVDNAHGIDQVAVAYCGRRLNWKQRPSEEFTLRTTVVDLVTPG